LRPAEPRSNFLIQITVSYQGIGHGGDICTSVEASAVEIRAPIEGAMVGELDNPAAAGALQWIEKRRSLVDVEKHVLHDLFGFAVIVEDPQGDSHYQAGIAV